MERLPKTHKGCAIFDLMAVIQPSGYIVAASSNFGEYSQKLLSYILKKAYFAHRIDIVYDRYITESIKQFLYFSHSQPKHSST